MKTAPPGYVSDQIWAGNDFGVMFLPRVGQEVIVDFLHGDPSHPIVVGSMYNANQKPPYALPDRKTISTIRSASSKDGSGLNELRFEDKSGAEEIYIHGQKDLTVMVGKDKNQNVANNENINVGNNRVTTISNNLNENVGGLKSISVGKDLSQSIANNFQVTIGNNLTETVGKTRKLTASKILITAQEDITLKSGKASIVMKKNGDIRISGKNITVKGGGNVTIKGDGDVKIKGKKTIT